MEESQRVRGQLDPDVWAQWEDEVWGMLVAEMARSKVTYKDLARRLSVLGIEESAGQLNRKVNRKRFTAAFFMACMAVLGVSEIPVPKIKEASEA